MSNVRVERSLFANEWESLKSMLASQPSQLAGVWVRMLREDAEAPAGSDSHKWRGPAAAAVAMCDSKGPWRAKAVAAFDLEWVHGDTLERNDHYVHSIWYLTSHRWIAAAMHGQLLILADRLAALGAIDDAKIDAIGCQAIENLATYVVPHWRGRGERPILHEPINQGAAMLMGSLYAGYLFGHKWRRWPRAQGMFETSRQGLMDHIGQFPLSGYDGDGFTYMRLIHHACLIYAIALLEDVTGEDWYFRRFQPHGWSVASLMERLIRMRCPSGYAWPLGRYGYVCGWNTPQLSFASRRTGDPAYLQLASADSTDSQGRSPWLGMESVLRLLWYPHNLEINTSAHAPRLRFIDPGHTHAEDTVVFDGDPDGLYVLATAMPENRPHIVAEFAKHPFILGLDVEPRLNNAVQFAGYTPERKLWMQPGGRLIRVSQLPGFDLAEFDTTANYGDVAELRESRRLIARLGDSRLLIADEVDGDELPSPTWSLRTWPDAQADGQVATASIPDGLQVCFVSASHAWTSEQLMPPGHARMMPENCRERLTHLKLCGDQSSDASHRFVALASFGEAEGFVPPQLDDSNGRVDILDGERSTALVQGPDGTIKTRGCDCCEWSVQADWALVERTRLVLIGGLEASCHAKGLSIWSTEPCDVEVADDTFAVGELPYGGRIAFWRPDGFVLFERTNSVVVHARCSSAFRVTWPAAWGDVTLNEEPLRDVPDSTLGWCSVSVPHASPSPDLESRFAAATAGDEVAPLYPLLTEIRASMAWELMSQVRALLAWDSAPGHDAERSPTLREGVHVRLEAARTVMTLGDRAAEQDLLSLLEREMSNNYGIGDTWHRSWWGSSARVAAIETLLTLGASSVAEFARRNIHKEIIPHPLHALRRVQRRFSLKRRTHSSPLITNVNHGKE